MRIREIKLCTLQRPEKGEIKLKLKLVPNLRRTQYTHEIIWSEGVQRASC